MEMYLKIIINLNSETYKNESFTTCSHFIHHTIRHHKVCSICYLVLNHQQKDCSIRATKIIKLPDWIPLQTVIEVDQLYTLVTKDIKPMNRTAILYACTLLCNYKLSYKESEALLKFFKLTIKKINIALAFLKTRIPSYNFNHTILYEPIIIDLNNYFNIPQDVGLYIMHYCKYYKKSFKTVWLEMTRKIYCSCYKN
nr:hypothetical protein 1J - lymphocystis disease virus (isolate dab) [Lymphocystis disease virus 1]